MKSIQELQNEWNRHMEEKNQLLRSIKESGFILVGDHIIEEKEVFAIQWSLSHQLVYEEDTGWHGTTYEGIREIDETLFKVISDAWTKQDLSTLQQLLTNHTNLDNKAVEALMNPKQLSTEHEKVRWITTKPNPGLFEMKTYSYVLIKKMLRSDTLRFSTIKNEHVPLGENFL